MLCGPPLFCGGSNADVGAQPVALVASTWPPLVNDKLDTLSKSGRIGVPTLIIHGDHDEVVPYDMGVTLSRSIAGARLVKVRGAHHNDIFAVEGTLVMKTICALAQR